MTTGEVFDKLLHGRTLEQINITYETKHIYDNVSNCYEVSDKKSGNLLFYVDEMRSNYSYTTDRYGRRVYLSYSFYDFVDPSWTKNTYNSVWAEKLYDKVDKIYKKSLETIKYTTNINAQNNRSR